MFSKFSVSSEIIISSSFFSAFFLMSEGGKQLIVLKQRQLTHTSVGNYLNVCVCQLFFNPHTSLDQ